MREHRIEKVTREGQYERVHQATKLKLRLLPGQDGGGWAESGRGLGVATSGLTPYAALI